MMKHFFALVLITFSFSSALAEGFSVRGGGDEAGLEFTNAYSFALEEIHKNYPDLAAKLAAYQLDGILDEVKIFVDDKPLHVDAGDGQQESVAVNEPATMRIWINRLRWNATTHPRIRQAIALHEVLSLRGVEGTGRYGISGAYLAKFNLRNDSIVFILGQDPSLPNWKSRSMSCERRMKARNVETGRILERSDYSLYVQAEWQILDKIYSLQFVFATERSGNWPVAINAPSLIQRVQAMDKKTPEGKVWKLGGRALFNTGVSYSETEMPATPRFEEKLSDGRTLISEWKNGKKGKKLSAFSESNLPDGSLRRVVEDLNLVYVKPVQQLEGIEDCVIKTLPSGEWLALSNSPEIGVEIEKLNARAMNLYDASRAHKGCQSGDCSKEKEFLDLRHKQFDQAWDRLFAVERDKLKAKFPKVR